MHIDVDVWFEYVRFAANIADWPSCGDYAVLVHELHAIPVDVVLPPAGTWRDIERAVADSALEVPVLGFLDE